MAFFALGYMWRPLTYCRAIISNEYAQSDCQIQRIFSGIMRIITAIIINRMMGDMTNTPCNQHCCVMVAYIYMYQPTHAYFIQCIIMIIIFTICIHCGNVNKQTTNVHTIQLESLFVLSMYEYGYEYEYMEDRYTIHITIRDRINNNDDNALSCIVLILLILYYYYYGSDHFYCYCYSIISFNIIIVIIIFESLCIYL